MKFDEYIRGAIFLILPSSINFEICFEILESGDPKITNGILEGINSKIQLAKRRARGYRNPKNFINIIYFISGKLNFDYPPYSL